MNRKVYSCVYALVARHTYLALVEEQTKMRDLDGLMHVGVLAHNQRRLAAELQRDVLQVALGGRDLNDLAHLSEKTEEGNEHMVTQR